MDEIPPSPYVMFLPKAGKFWINSNDRLFWMERSRRTRAWRDLAREQATTLFVPHLPAGYVVCELVFADRRRRDPANWAPTAKACIDGLVDAGVFPDDDYKHVTGPDMRIADPSIATNTGVRLLIYPREPQ